MDEETGLVSMGARYLDPRTGRFTQPDPVGLVDPATGKVNQEMLLNPQRLNRYVYALNNPYRYVDPEGDFAILGAAILGAAIAYFSHPDIANAPKRKGNKGDRFIFQPFSAVRVPCWRIEYQLKNKSV
jgi:RHS repeat-associated protein